MQNIFKKTFILFPALLLVAGCGTRTDLPEDIYNYLKAFSFNKTYYETNGGKVISTYQEFDSNNNIKGEKKEVFTFSKTSENTDFEFEYKCEFSGNQIDANDGLKTTTAELFKNDNGDYQIIKKENSTITLDETLIFENAYSYMISIFYTNDSPYRYGGLYYGDYFQINSHTFGLNYKIKEDGNLYFESKHDENYFEGAVASQILAINNNGMIVYCDQKVTINETKEYATQKIEATYKN